MPTAIARGALAATVISFEAIHPFVDGNCRTGLLTLSILYLSRHIIAHKVDYYRLLLDNTRSGSFESWRHLFGVHHQFER